MKASLENLSAIVLTKEQEAIKNKLIEIANNLDIITYSKLFMLVLGKKVEQMSPTEISDTLTAVSLWCLNYMKLDHLLSVVVIRNSTQMPGDGFFELASKMGCKGSKMEVFADQLNKCRNYWGADKDTIK